jgi:TonB family protein
MIWQRVSTWKANLPRVVASLAFVSAQAVHAQVVRPQLDVRVPRGENLRDQPEQPTDVVFTLDREGRYFLNGAALDPKEIGSRLGAIFGATSGDRVLYVRADARLSFGNVRGLNALAARSGVCVVSMIGEQLPGTVSHVRTDRGQTLFPLRRAVDVQLPPQSASSRSLGLKDMRIILEVLPGPAYRINSVAVPASDLSVRLQEIFNPRPNKVLFVTADSAATFDELFHAMDLARSAGVVVLRAPAEGDRVPGRLPDIDLSMRVTALDTTPNRCRVDGVETVQPPLAAGDGGVYFDFQVATQVRPIPGPAPRYPEVLRNANVTGDVLMQFVVNTDGTVDTTTAHSLKSTHDFFTQAVRTILPDLRFVPATLQGKPVRQLVQMPFVFSLQQGCEHIQLRFADTVYRSPGEFVPPNTRVYRNGANGWLYPLRDTVVLDERGITSVSVWPTRLGSDTTWAVLARTTSEGARALADATAKHVGRYIGIMVGNDLVDTAIIESKLAGSVLQLRGNVTRAVADSLARRAARAISAECVSRKSS